MKMEVRNLKSMRVRLVLQKIKVLPAAKVK
jgi:hypothetical protein